MKRLTVQQVHSICVLCAERGLISEVQFLTVLRSLLEQSLHEQRSYVDIHGMGRRPSPFARFVAGYCLDCGIEQ